ncbi:protein translocase subunit SecF [bacterium]|nr:protein translocase subunit SecF [bacterium]
MIELIRPGTQIDFAGKRHIFVGLSIVSVIAALVLFLTKGLNYGIDFTGGAEVQVRAPQGWDIGRVREEMSKADLKGLKVVQLGDNVGSEFLVKAQGAESELNQVAQKVEQVLSRASGAGQYEIKRVDVVGPAAGSSLRKSGFLSMFYALLGILVYVALRFDVRYAPGAVLALFHDTAITIGVFILMQKQFDLLTLAALLALIGYSNNDTIIVYDRVRETLAANPKLSIEEAVNKATNETLGRTILTSLTTFLTAGALWLFGGPVIHDFAFTFMIGIVIGSYSSIFVASSLVIYITHYRQRRSANPAIKKKRQVTVRPEPKFTT